MVVGLGVLTWVDFDGCLHPGLRCIRPGVSPEALDGGGIQLRICTQEFTDRWDVTEAKTSISALFYRFVGLVTSRVYIMKELFILRSIHGVRMITRVLTQD